MSLQSQIFETRKNARLFFPKYKIFYSQKQRKSNQILKTISYIMIGISSVVLKNFRFFSICCYQLPTLLLWLTKQTTLLLFIPFCDNFYFLVVQDSTRKTIHCYCFWETNHFCFCYYFFCLQQELWNTEKYNIIFQRWSKTRLICLFKECTDLVFSVLEINLNVFCSVLLLLLALFLLLYFSVV